LGKDSYLIKVNTKSPYNLPCCIKEIKPESIRDMDNEYFAVNGKLLLQEGKTFKAHIERERNDGKKFNSIEVGKYYDEAIKAMGGVQVNNVSVPKSQVDSVCNPQLIDKRYGYSIDYNLLDDIKTYIIRTKTGLDPNDLNE
jgi:OOP family OmpA-OmpF porin